MARLYYDLSELFLGSGQKYKYYGIARTVMEVGYELAQLEADVGFVVFSPGHGHFFEVRPRMGNASPTGVFDPGLPPSAAPRRMRLNFRKKNLLRDALYPALLALIRRINLGRWKSVPEGVARPINLDGQILVSLGRPKIMTDYLIALKQIGQRPRFFPLLHDMIPLHEAAGAKGGLFASKFAHDNRLVIAHAAGLLANSDFTRSEIERFSQSGHLPDIPPVATVPLAHELRATAEPVVKRGPEAPYLICVGTQTGRKNLECLLEALLQLHREGRQVPQLVLAGARRKRAESYLERAELQPIRPRIHFLLNPNQAELRALYEEALALVIPSRMEGWGLPLGEALWLGTPALASTAPALREVGGDLALYFDPDKPEVLAGQIADLMADPGHLSALQTRIAEGHGQLRAWSHVARDILTLVPGSLSPST